MAKKPTVTTLASGFNSTDVLNTNFENLKEGFDNTLSLDGSTPNAMGADLDINNNKIINAAEISTSVLTVGGVDVTAVQGPQGPAGPTGPAGADSTVAGPTGPQGPQGPQGPAGADGADGSDGADSTVAGPTGPQGATGPQGPQGPAGADGADGADGASYTHPNHSGEVTSTGDGATVIADNVVDEANLKVSNTPTDGYVLTAQSGNTGGLTWASVSGGGSSYTHPNHSGEVTSTGDGATVIASNVVDADNLKVTGNGTNTQFLRSDGDGTFTWATPVDTNTTYSIGDGGLTTNDFTNADHTKLDGIATGATAYTNANAVSAVTASDLDMGGNKVLFGNMYSALSDLPSASTYHGMFAHVHATGKGYFAHNGSWVPLANASDIVNYTVQDGQLSQNNFTDADHTKLNAIEDNATADQTASEIRTLIESATDSNVFTDADHTKLNAIEASADVTDTANVVAALTAGTNVSIAANGTISSTDTNTTYSIGDGGLTTNDFTNADHTKLDGIATSANNYTHPNHSGEVTSTSDGATVIADNVVDEANLKVSNAPTDGYVLTAQSGNTGGLTWAAAASGGGGSSPDLYAENYDGTSTKPSATGTNAVAIGVGASATTTGSFVVLGSASSGEYGIVMGVSSTGVGNMPIAIGSSASSGTRSISIGQSTTSNGTGSVAIGANTFANPSSGDGAVGLGYWAYAKGASSFANSYSRAGGASSVALGITSQSSTYGASGANSIALGQLSKATQANSIAIGDGAISTTANQIALGGATDTVKISNTYTLPIADGTNGQVLTTNGSGVSSWATAGGGGSSDYVHISTQTITSATAQVEFDLSNSDYGSYYIVAHDCAFTAAPTNEYCLYFNLYEGAYSSSAPWTNRMSLYYAQGIESGSSVSTSSTWTYNLTMRSGSTPTTSTKFGFSGMIGGRTNSPVDLNGYFVTGTSAVGAPRIRGIAPNTSNNMTYMLVKPSTTTFASGKFALYGLKDA